jgi:hypothetical protein
MCSLFRFNLVWSENCYLIIMCNPIIFWIKSMIEMGDLQIIIYITRGMPACCYCVQTSFYK